MTADEHKEAEAVYRKSLSKRVPQLTERQKETFLRCFGDPVPYKKLYRAIGFCDAAIRINNGGKRVMSAWV